MNGSFPQSKMPAAFSLVEMLMVTGIIALLMAAAIPAMNSIMNGKDLTRAHSEVAGILEQARAYAMANNTYVFVGFREVDGLQADTAVPQQVGKGRILVAVVASKDGTRGYNALAAAGTWSGAANLVAISKLQRFDKVHLGDSAPKVLDGMAEVEAAYSLAGTTVPTTFDWPLAGGSKICTFSQVIQFDPQGSAGIPGRTELPPWLEIILQPARGNTVEVSNPNFAVLQVDGITGTARRFRP